MTQNSRCFTSSKVSFPVLSVTLSVLAGLLSTGCVADAVVGDTSSTTAPIASEPTTNVQAVALEPADEIIASEAYTHEGDPAEAHTSEIDPSDAYASADGRIDAQGNLLPEIIDGLTVGMPYAEARELIIDGIWLPRTYPPVEAGNVGVAALHQMGFEEARECSGTGLGLCRLEFVEREGLLFGVVVTTADAMPTVWSWFVE